MRHKFSLIKLLLTIWFSQSLTMSSSKPYQNIQLEPYSVIEGKPIDTDPNSRWSINIYIIFGKRRFKPIFNPKDGGDPICHDSMCIRAFGICIQLGKDKKELLEGIGSGDDTNFGNLTTAQQKKFTDSFFDIFTNSTVQEVDYVTAEGTLNGPQNGAGQLGYTDIAKMFLGRNRQLNWDFELRNAFLVEYGGNNVVIGIGSGNKTPGGEVLYKFNSQGSNVNELVPYDNCLFNRILLKIYYCSKLFYNRELCLYYTRLVMGKVSCGEDYTEEVNKTGPIEAILKWIRLLRKLIEIIFG